VLIKFGINFGIILDISSPRSLHWGVQITGMNFKTRAGITKKE